MHPFIWHAHAIIKGACNKAPFLFIVTSTIIGILTYSFVPYNFLSIYLFVCLGVILLFSFILYKIGSKLTLLLYTMWFILFGYSITHLYAQKNTPLLGYSTEHIRLTSSGTEKPKTIMFYIQTLESKSKAIVYIAKDSLSKQLHYGDIISIQGTFKPITNSKNSTFDYKAFLENRYIFSSAYIPKHAWKYESSQKSILTISESFRKSCIALLSEFGITESNNSILAALVFGDKSLLDSEISKSFAASGAMHILAVSGLHVGIIASLLVFITSFWSRRKPIIKIACIIVGIWTYACITGLSYSVIRASIMFSVITIGYLLQRNSSIFNSLAFAAFISICLSPLSIYDVGFQLSYSAVIGIAAVAPLFKRYFFSKYLVYNYFLGIIALSIAVQITTVPLGIYYFNSFPTYSLLTNCIVIPLSFVIVCSTLLLLIIGNIPIIGDAFAYITNWSTDFLQNVIIDIASFSNAKISFTLTKSEIIWYYCIIAVLLLGVAVRKELRIKKQLV